MEALTCLRKPTALNCSTVRTQSAQGAMPCLSISSPDAKLERKRERERERKRVCVCEGVQHCMNINIECDMHVYMYNYVGRIQSEWSTIGNSLRVFPQYDPVVVTPMEHPQVSEQPIFDCLPHQQHTPKCHHLNQQDPLCHQAEAHCSNLRHEVMCAHTCPVVNSQLPTPCLSLSLSHTLSHSLSLSDSSLSTQAV